MWRRLGVSAQSRPGYPTHPVVYPLPGLHDEEVNRLDVNDHAHLQHLTVHLCAVRTMSRAVNTVARNKGYAAPSSHRSTRSYVYADPGTEREARAPHSCFTMIELTCLCVRDKDTLGPYPVQEHPQHRACPGHITSGARASTPSAPLLP